MKYIVLLFLYVVLLSCNATKFVSKKPLEAPEFLKGEFVDDYGIKYTINDTLWIQRPTMKFNIIEWNEKEQYLLAQNDRTNKTEPGLYTRIDYMKFDNMEPYEWGFCLTEYKAKTLNEALIAVKADRNNPRKGCNGYPFSRMKKRID